MPLQCSPASSACLLFVSECLFQIPFTESLHISVLKNFYSVNDGTYSTRCSFWRHQKNMTTSCFSDRCGKVVWDNKGLYQRAFVWTGVQIFLTKGFVIHPLNLKGLAELMRVHESSCKVVAVVVLRAGQWRITCCGLLGAPEGSVEGAVGAGKAEQQLFAARNRQPRGCRGQKASRWVTPEVSDVRASELNSTWAWVWAWILGQTWGVKL